MASFYYAIDMINNRTNHVPDACNSGVIAQMKKETVIQCTHCRMFGHAIGECALSISLSLAPKNCDDPTASGSSPMLMN